MKIKRIMLVTLMLLAVLAIGAVSATDDVSSGNLTVADEAVSDELAVSDDEDIKANEDIYDKYKITVWDEMEICIDPDDEEIAYITVPDTATSGSFKILNGEDIVASINVNFNDDDHWDYSDEDGYYDGTIYLSEFDLDKVNNGDILSFKFFDGNGVAVESLTQKYSVKLTETTMELIYADSGIDGDIKVNKIDTSKPDENFTYVYVNAKDGFFEITVDDSEGEELDIFSENLKTTNKNYTIIDDGNGNMMYRFGFSYNDINNFIQNEFECTFIDLLNDDDLIDTDEPGITFYLYEDETEESEIDSIYMSFTISDGIISFINDDEDLPVDVDYYLDSEIVMEGDWQDQDVLTFNVEKGITGRIVIYLNDNEIPAFNKTLTEKGPDELDEEDDEFDYYTITIRDLNITEEGKYIIRDYFYDDNGEIIYQYDDEDPESFELVSCEVITDGDVTFVFYKTKILSNSSDTVFRIRNVIDSGDDEIVIYIDDIKKTIKLNDCQSDDEGNYTVLANQLGKLSAGTHTLNVTCKGSNALCNITIKSNLVIEFPDNDEIIYTTFNESFVSFTLDEGEKDIIDSGIEGIVNITISDDGGNVVDTIEKNIGSLVRYEGDYIIKTGQMNKVLNGKYLVVVKYFGGNEADTQNAANVTFKEFGPKDCNVSINESLKDATSHVITFDDIPPTDNFIVEVDGNKTSFRSSEVKYDSDKEVYYINNDKLKLTDGTHSIRVLVETDKEDIILASGNIYVDLVENIDPALTVSVDNITEGADAVIVITTNTTFSGDVQVKIANTNYTVSVTNGLGNYSVSGLAAGTYNVTAIFKGNAFFNESTKNTTFTVNPKVATTITAPALTTTYATSKNIVVTLKDANGNPLVEKEVTVSLNGASKTLKTNAKGQVSYAIGSKLAPKTYTAAIKFAGDSAYLASSGTVKVTVKKAKAKMTAKKKTFKAKKKTKKYSIVLKTDKGKALKKAKVTLKVKGKKYTAKTNSKGKAVFKIKKLTKKGKYKAKVKFAGNKYYNKLTKKVKIKVKK